MGVLLVRKKLCAESFEGMAGGGYCGNSSCSRYSVVRCCFQ